MKIGVVNVVRLLEESPQSKAVNAALQDEFAPRQRELQAMERELQEKQEMFRRDASVMGEEERLNLEREIRDGQRDFQRAQNEALEDWNIRLNEERGKLNRILLQQVQQYARAEDYDLVVADALYFSDAVDITSEVLEELKKQSATTSRSGSGSSQ
ncbi:MAG TPA: OmpH family outer membrane protein [Gammaproteobacteria bacterium]